MTTVRGPAIYGTPLLLCADCWLLVDPTVPPTPLPLPTPSAVSYEETLPVAYPGPPITPPPRPSPLEAPPVVVSDELATLPYRPRSRMGPLFSTGMILGMIAVVVVLVGGYLLWHRRMHYPDFQEYTSPDGEYTVALPVKPKWSGYTWDSVASIGARAEAERDTGFWGETYRVRVIWIDPARRSRNRTQESVAKALADGAPVPALVVRLRGDAPGCDAAAEFERRDAPGVRITVVGRVVVIGDLAYELTVTGRNVSLNDQRVQKFFDSFRLNRAASGSE